MKQHVVKHLCYHNPAYGIIIVQSAHGKIDFRIGRLKAGAPEDLISPPKPMFSNQSFDEAAQSAITTIEREEHRVRFVEIEKVEL